jgi:tetratricopeptide (TPR) repeat protein
LGVLITIAEPDLQVLANQVSSVMNGELLKYIVGIGVGGFLIIAILRIVFKRRLSIILMLFYMLLFALALILFEKGKYTEARIYIDQAMLNGGAESSVVVEHCGDIYYLNGEREKALEYWKQAEKLAKEVENNEDEARTPKEMKLLRKKILNKKYFVK